MKSLDIENAGREFPGHRAPRPGVETRPRNQDPRALTGSGRSLQADLGDLTVDDAIGACLGLLSLQGHDQVMPGRVGRSGDIGGARVGLGVGVAVHYSPDLEAILLGGQFGAQVIGGIDRVDPGRLFEVAAREEADDLRRARRPGHEAARLERVLGQGQRAHGVECVGSDRQSLGRTRHRISVPAGP